MPKRRADAVMQADLVDVHLLDIAAQIESMLRGLRQVQRGILDIRRSGANASRVRCE